MAGPKNFYNAVDSKKLGIDKIKDIDTMSEDISDIKAELSTLSAVSGNVEELATSKLFNIQIGDNVYSTGDLFKGVKYLRFEMTRADGGEDDAFHIDGMRFLDPISNTMLTFPQGTTVDPIDGIYDSARILNPTGTDEVGGWHVNYPINFIIRIGGTGIDLNKYSKIGFLYGWYADSTPDTINTYISTDGENWALIGSATGITYDAPNQINYFIEFEHDIPVVTPNPQGSATGTLTSLGIDSDIYSIPTGSSVTANPSGTATNILNKIKIDDTIYKPSGNSTHVVTLTEDSGTAGKYYMSEQNGTIKNWITNGDIVIFKLPKNSNNSFYCHLSGEYVPNGGMPGEISYEFSGILYFTNGTKPTDTTVELARIVMNYSDITPSRNIANGDIVTLIQ